MNIDNRTIITLTSEQLENLVIELPNGKCITAYKSHDKTELYVDGRDSPLSDDSYGCVAIPLEVKPEKGLYIYSTNYGDFDGAYKAYVKNKKELSMDHIAGYYPLECFQSLASVNLITSVVEDCSHCCIEVVE